MCALWRIHPSNLSIPVQHNWSWSVSFHQNVHQFSGGRDCRQDHKHLLKGCFVCERFKYWQVSKTCIIWIVHGKLSQLLLRKSSPGRFSRPLIKPTLVINPFSKRSFRKFSTIFTSKRKRFKKVVPVSGLSPWATKTTILRVLAERKRPQFGVSFFLYWHREKVPSFVLYASRTVSHHICLV